MNSSAHVSRRWLALALALLLAGSLLAAGCGGGSSKTSSASGGKQPVKAAHGGNSDHATLTQQTLNCLRQGAGDPSTFDGTVPANGTESAGWNPDSWVDRRLATDMQSVQGTSLLKATFTDKLNSGNPYETSSSWSLEAFGFQDATAAKRGLLDLARFAPDAPNGEHVHSLFASQNLAIALVGPGHPSAQEQAAINRCLPLRQHVTLQQAENVSGLNVATLGKCLQAHNQNSSVTDLMDPNGDNQSDALSSSAAEPNYLNLTAKWAVVPSSSYGENTELDVYVFSTPADASALATDLRQRAQAAKDTGTAVTSIPLEGVQAYGPAALVEAGHPVPTRTEIEDVTSCLGAPA